MHLLLPTILLLSLTMASSGAPQARAATSPPEPIPTSVKLAFAWPAGMSVVTTSTRKRTRIALLDKGQRQSMEQLDTTDIAFSYGR